METSKSIIGRNILGIDDRRILGKVTDLRVDCDSRAVNFLVMKEAALPFDKVIGIGDSFVTVQKEADFAKVTAARSVINKGYRLIDAPVFSRTGNELGVVKEYSFDPETGAVTSITLKNGTIFEADTFEFFIPAFVLVDDEKQVEKKPAAKKPAAKSAKSAAKPAPKKVEEPVPAPETEQLDLGDASEADLDADLFDDLEETIAPVSSAPGDAPAPPNVSLDDLDPNDRSMIEELLGLTVSDDVVSEDGLFSVAAGTELTMDIVMEAQKHDALIELGLNVAV